MRALAVAILLLASVLMAETQQAAYYRALKAEEAGDIPAALKAFEEAVLLPGEYTEEIQEIIDSYNLAMGKSGSDSIDVSGSSISKKTDTDLIDDGEKSSLLFRFLGDMGFYGLHYEEYGGVDNVRENGGDLFLNLSGFLDYTTRDWIHSFGVSAIGDWFLNNENMPALDTCDWKMSMGLEYVLLGKSLLVDLGVDLNFAENIDMFPAFYGWIEKDIFRFEKQRVGVAGWFYDKSDGPTSFALYASWHRTEVFGWNGSVYLGARFEADSVLDYMKFVADYEAALEAASESSKNENSFDNPWNRDPYDNFNDNGYKGDNNYYGSPYVGGFNNYYENAFEDTKDDFGVEDSVINVAVHKAWGAWIGPTLKSKVSYKFRTKITVEALFNLFYGFVVDGPDYYYEKIKKFSGTWGLTLYWKPGFGSIYLGLEQLYRHLSLPSYYQGIYAESSFLTELKAGVKWEI